MSKTIKVRIPFCVSADGRWCAYGYPNAQTEPDWTMVEEVADNGGEFGSYQRGWIEVELPIPSEAIVSGNAIMEGD